MPGFSRIRRFTGGAPSPYLLYDTFTEVDGTSIQLPHSMNVGGGYIRVDGTWSISSNKARKTASNNSHQFVCAEAGDADVTHRILITLPAGGFASAAVRVSTGTNNLWFVQLDQAGGFFRLWEMVTGTPAQRASASVTLAAGGTFTVVTVTSGATITSTLDGGTQITYPSATLNQTTTSHGFGSFTINASFDDFSVVS